VDRDEFWALVAANRAAAAALPATERVRGLLRHRTVERRLTQRQVQALRDQLARSADDDVLAFRTHLDAVSRQAYTWDLWGAAYVAHGGLGDDSFTDLRTWLVMQGREAWERVLSDPDALVELQWREDGEDLGDAELWAYVAKEVWEERHGDGLPVDPLEPARAPAGEPFDEDDEDALRRRYPRLAGRYL
jgi:hypothetical protein